MRSFSLSKTLNDRDGRNNLAHSALTFPRRLLDGGGGFIPRGLAFFLGGFSLLNVIANLGRPGFDPNIWWIDLRWAPMPLANIVLLVSGVSLFAFSVSSGPSRFLRVLTGSCAAVLGSVALFNAADFYLLLFRKAIHAGLPISISLLVVLSLGVILAACVTQKTRLETEQRILPIFGVCIVCALVFALVQIFCFGKTDYHRQADVAVVLGARAYADGRPSDALADRVRTACQLYREGWVSKLLFSGGPGEGTINETESMKRMALQLGVPAEDIILDQTGLNTRATAKNTEAICSRLRLSRVLVVSHFYHLPRVKLAYQRDGWEVYTVPAKESYLLRQMPYNIAREVAALWVYYLRAIAG